MLTLRNSWWRARLSGLPWFLVAVAAVAALPYVAWRLTPTRFRSVVILDKTVPVPTYREHRGLMWILDHAKVNQAEGRHEFRIDRDYYGFFPLPKQRWAIRDLPAGSASCDLVYVADTYGVYTEDFEVQHPPGEKSELIYGGLTDHDVSAIRGRLHGGSTLVAEFNAFGSPTRDHARRGLLDLLGIDWSGWTGRYFTDLKVGGEVPAAIVQSWSDQNGKPWEFQGPGFVYVHEDGRVVVLRDGTDVGPRGLRVAFRTGEASRYHAVDRVPYAYWFDLVSPRRGTAVMADYVLDLTASGAAIVSDAGLPTTWPAMLRAEHPGYRSYYFAGDYADSDEVPTLWQFRGLDGLLRTLGGNPFFWNVYSPVMGRILDDLGPAPARPRGPRRPDRRGRSAGPHWTRTTASAVGSPATWNR